MEFNASLFMQKVTGSNAESKIAAEMRPIELVHNLMLWDKVEDIDTSIPLEDILDAIEEAPKILSEHLNMRAQIDKLARETLARKGIRKRRFL